jgi:hypothetical protein
MPAAAAIEGCALIEPEGRTRDAERTRRKKTVGV